MPTQEETPFYIRTAQGGTFHTETMDEALEQFVSEDGYRITFSGAKVEIVIRRDADPRNLAEDELLKQTSYNATIVVREVK